MSEETRYSLKKPSDRFWRTDISEQQVLKQLEESTITGDWLICPLGEANRSITVANFVANPAVLATRSPDPSGDMAPTAEWLVEDLQRANHRRRTAGYVAQCRQRTVHQQNPAGPHAHGAQVGNDVRARGPSLRGHS